MSNHFLLFNRKFFIAFLSLVCSGIFAACGYERVDPEVLEDIVWQGNLGVVVVTQKGTVIKGHCRVLPNSSILFANTKGLSAIVTFDRDARLTIDPGGALILDGVRLIMNKPGAVLCAGNPGRSPSFSIRMIFKFEKFLRFLYRDQKQSLGVEDWKIMKFIEYVLGVPKAKFILNGNCDGIQLELVDGKFLINGIVEIVPGERSDSKTEALMQLNGSLGVEIDPSSKLRISVGCIYVD